MNLNRILVPLGALALAATTWAALRQEGGMPGPGKHHEILKLWEGTWEAQVGMPSMGDTTFPGVETNRLLGGMWVISDFEGEFAGMPFAGHSTLGWSDSDQAYVSTWIDTMASQMPVHKGQWNAEKRTLEMSGDGWDMLGEKVKQRSTTRFVGDDAMEVEMFDGDELTLTIKYKRKS